MPEQAVEPVEEEERMSRKGRRRQTKELAQAVVAEMSPEQREKWLHVAQTNKWLNKTVEFQGRKVLHTFAGCWCNSSHFMHALLYVLLAPFR